MATDEEMDQLIGEQNAEIRQDFENAKNLLIQLQEFGYNANGLAAFRQRLIDLCLDDSEDIVKFTNAIALIDQMTDVRDQLIEQMAQPDQVDQADQAGQVGGQSETDILDPISGRMKGRIERLANLRNDQWGDGKEGTALGFDSEVALITNDTSIDVTTKINRLKPVEDAIEQCILNEELKIAETAAQHLDLDFDDFFGSTDDNTAVTTNSRQRLQELKQRMVDMKARFDRRFENIAADGQTDRTKEIELYTAFFNKHRPNAGQAVDPTAPTTANTASGSGGHSSQSFAPQSK